MNRVCFFYRLIIYQAFEPISFFRHRRIRDQPFLIAGTRAERIWVGYKNFLMIFDGARKIFATILWGAK